MILGIETYDVAPFALSFWTVPGGNSKPRSVLAGTQTVLLYCPVVPKAFYYNIFSPHNKKGSKIRLVLVFTGYKRLWYKLTWFSVDFTVTDVIQCRFESPHDKINKMVCAPSEDSDQSGHSPSLIRVFAVRMKKAWVLSYPFSAQQILWSDWADAQAESAQSDLSLRWAHMPFC